MTVAFRRYSERQNQNTEQFFSWMFSYVQVWSMNSAVMSDQSSFGQFAGRWVVNLIKINFLPAHTQVYILFNARECSCVFSFLCIFTTQKMPWALCVLSHSCWCSRVGEQFLSLPLCLCLPLSFLLCICLCFCLCLCLCICICLFLCICICVCFLVFVFAQRGGLPAGVPEWVSCVCLRICICVCICVCLCLCFCFLVSVFVFVFLSLCLHSVFPSGWAVSVFLWQSRQVIDQLPQQLHDGTILLLFLLLFISSISFDATHHLLDSPRTHPAEMSEWSSQASIKEADGDQSF